MMTNKLYIGDIHLNLNKLKSIIKTQESNFDKIVFLGDYFDHFVEGMDGYCTSQQMAKWLKDNLANPKYIFMMGNHDIPYACNYFNTNMCGFTFDKKKRINSILTEEDWNTFKYFDITKDENEYWVASHAGFNKSHWPVYNPIEKLKEQEKMFMKDIRSNLTNYWLKAGNDRGFPDQKIGGFLWCDWENISDIPGVRQIVGHTPGHFPRTTANNYNIDTGLNFIGYLRNEENMLKFKLIKTN